MTHKVTLAPGRSPSGPPTPPQRHMLRPPRTSPRELVTVLIWPGWRLALRIERIRPKRCRFTHQTAGGPMRCIFDAGHPDHGHTCTDDLTAPPVPARR